MLSKDKATTDIRGRSEDDDGVICGTTNRLYWPLTMVAVHISVRPTPKITATNSDAARRLFKARGISADNLLLSLWHAKPSTAAVTVRRNVVFVPYR